jgi:hypothetical protein
LGVSRKNNNQTLVFLLWRYAVNRRGVVNIQTPRPSSYTPANTNPLRLATAAIEAVDWISLAACGEMEKTADDIICGANEVADNLRRLATAIRENGKVASVHVTDFCNKATTVFEGVRDLQDRLLLGQRRAEAEETEDSRSPLPKVIRRELPTAAITACVARDLKGVVRGQISA